jgi:DNA methylase
VSPDRHSPADPPASAITASTSQEPGTAPSSPLVTADAVPVPERGRIWLTGQHPSRTQRTRRYTAESMAHPAKMMPTVAAHAIATYTRPGEWVCDPMCGIGTTLVEAVRAGRPALGVEYEPRWAALTRSNLALAAADGYTSLGRVITGDARHLSRLVPPNLHAQVALVVTSPPYGPSLHGRLANPTTEPIRKINHRYGDQADRANLANLPHHRLLAGFTRILTETTALLRPGGHVVITVRPWREHGELIDLPAQIISCLEQAGLVVTERAVALLGRVIDTGAFVARGSFFQRDYITKQRRAGLPLHLLAHEDVIVAVKLNPATGHAGNAVPERGPAGRGAPS